MSLIMLLVGSYNHSPMINSNEVDSWKWMSMENVKNRH